MHPAPNSISGSITSARSKRLVVVAYGLGLLIAAVAMLGLVRLTDGTSIKDSTTRSRHPLVIDVHVPSVPGLSADLEPSIKKIWPRRGDSLSLLIHSLHALHHYTGDNREVPLGDAMRVLLDSRLALKWFDNNLALQRSRSGVRFIMPLTPGRFSQAHVDQVLALLAEYEIPLDEPLVVPDGAATVEDLLRDCRAELRLRGEFEWSILALALYAPGQNSWKNRFDERLSFDRAAAALMLKPFDAGSCGGGHILYTLAALSQISEKQGLLRADVLKAVNEYLWLVRDAVVSAQRADGAIDPSWSQSLAVAPEFLRLRTFARSLVHDPWSSESRRPEGNKNLLSSVPDWVNVTAHHCEWLMVLTPGQQPDPAFFGRCARFLQAAIQDVPEAAVREFFCPYSHAILILRRLTGAAGPVEPGRDVETVGTRLRGCTAALHSAIFTDRCKRKGLT